MNIKSVFFLIFLFVCTLTNAQIFIGQEADARFPGTEIVVLEKGTSSLKFLKLRSDVIIKTSETENWLREELKIPQDIELKIQKTEKDKIGYTHFTFSVLSENIKLEPTVIKVHILNNHIISINAELHNLVFNRTISKINEYDAFEISLKWMNCKTYKWNQNNISNEKNPEGEQVLLWNNNKYQLTWKFDIYSIEPLKRYYIYVNAENGRIEKTINRIQIADVQGSAATMYNGTRNIMADSYSGYYRLRESGRGGGIETYDLNNSTSSSSAVDFTDTDNIWNTTTNQDNAAYDAHFGTEATYDYYYNTFGRNSYDGFGAKMLSYVHYSYDYVNAFWDGTAMWYGDGDLYSGYTPLTSLDIVAHEITHGVTENSAGLIYSGESGALNESYSDVFGVVIDFYANPTTANYLMGDQVSTSGTAFRSMSNPNLYGNPDTYLGDYWDPFEEVHCNSGVMNFWFYLLTNGATGVNDIGNSFTVNGIGMNSAASIAYRSLVTYLTPSSTYDDARFYSIQSAIDLFGNCSPEVIATTNAWYAVGVGSIFSNAVIAGFIASNTYSCTIPASINFTNSSYNATSYLWNFGDATTSTLANPSHSYTGVGTYTVSLIANGVATCGNADTLIMPNLITVTNTGGPISASCTPGAVSNGLIGIWYVALNTISNSSVGSSEGYKDFTCSNSTTVTEGLSYPVHVTTGAYTNENVKIWIDLDNNGQFNNTNEVVFNSLNKLVNHDGNIIIPATTNYNIPLRLRVASDNSLYTITTACATLQNGQYEDYTVIINQNLNPPIAKFCADDSIVNTGSTVIFSDLSLNTPTQWNWSFPGGIPSSSTQQNPSVIYNSLGDFSVTLIVTDTYGIDTLVKANYIKVLNEYDMCSTTSTIATSGILYDSGGSTGNYSDLLDCTFLISIPCAQSITMTFSQFSTESNYDILRVYDGPNASSPLLLTASGNTIPATIIASSGYMYITFTTDGCGYTSTGYSASWTSVVPSGTGPITDFSISDINPPLSASVQFTDQTTNIPLSWIWDFGDGQSSTIQNPSHAYSTSGNYTISLIAFNCYSSDTITKTITVQLAPSYSISPLSINVTLANCNDSITVPLTVTNSGTGELVVDVENTGSTNMLNVLAMTYGVDMATEYPHTISAINQYFTDYTLITTSTTTASVLQSQLIGKNVLLVPEIESGSASTFTPLTSVIQAFISNGGTAIFLGSSSISNQHIFNMGLFSGSQMNYSSSGNMYVVDASNPLANLLPSVIPAQNSTVYCNFTNSDAFCVVDYNNILTNEVITYRQIGTGKVIYIGYDYFAYDNNAARIIANAMVWAQTGTLPDYLSVTPITDTISTGSSGVFNVTLSTNGNNSGTYTTNLYLNTNDPLNPIDTIPVTMTIIGQPEITLLSTCINFGSIMENSFLIDTFSVINTGCDTLSISGVDILTGPYQIVNFTNNILPEDTGLIVVKFEPVAIGIYPSNIVLHSNLPDTTLCLNGIAVGAPEMTITPLILDVTLTGCDQVTSVPLSISNSGNGPLNIEVNGNNPGSLQVLAMTYGTDMATEYPNTISAINQYFTDYTLTTTTTTTASVLQTQLVGKNVLLVPEIESGSASTFTPLASVIQTFISNGGTAIFLGSSYISNLHIFNMGLFSGSQISNASSGNMYILNASHPLADMLPSIISAQSATTYCNFTNTDAYCVVDYNNILTNEVVTYRQIGMGRVIYIGYDYYLYDNNAARIISNALIWAQTGTLPEWLSILPDTATIPMDSTEILNVTFDGTGLNTGTYNSEIIILSNDPLNPSDTISCVLHINGDPQISLSNTCLNFGSIMEGTSLTDTLMVYNTGCDTLHITDMTSILVQFQIVHPNYILPGDTGFVIVTFLPDTMGSYTSNIIIDSDLPDTMVCLTGNATGAPQITYMPTSINVTIPICDGTTSQSLVIYNNGEGNLNYNISGGSTSTNLQVLAYTNGADLYTEYPNTISAINQYFTDYTLTTTTTTSASVLQTLLAGKNVFLIPEIESGSASTFIPFASVLQSFVSGGGTVIFLGSSTISNQHLFNTGMFTGTYTSSVSSGNLNVSSTPSPLTDGLPSTILAQSLVTYCNFTNTDAVCAIYYSNVNNEIATYRNIGSGKVIYIGYDYYAYDNNSTRLIANAVQWNNQFILPDWLSVSPDSGIVNVGDSAIVTFLFDATGLNAGVYNTDIVISSNDPLSPIDTIPCTMTVIGTPIAGLSDTCINFPDIYAGTSYTDTIYISNSGCGNLLVTSLVATPSAFSATVSSGTVLPDSTNSIIVTFSSSTLGTYSGNLTISTNDGVYNVCLNGNVLDAPDINVTPTSLNVSVSCHDTVTLPLHIQNIGGDTLNYSIGSGTGGSVQVLAMTYGVDLAEEYPHTIAAINQYFTNYTLTTTSTTTASVLQTQLIGKNVLLVPEIETGSASTFTPLTSVIQAFISNGGTAIFLGSYYISNQHIFNMGLFSGTQINYTSSGNMYVVDASNPLANLLPSVIPAQNLTIYCNFTNSDAYCVVDYNNILTNEVVTYRQIGMGKVIYIGYDFYEYDNNAARIISNAVQWSSGTIPSWMIINPTSGNVSSGSSQDVDVSFTSGGLSGGTYYYTIAIESNDPLTPTVNIPCTLNVSFSPCAYFGSLTSLCNGTVFFTDSSSNTPTSWHWNFGDGSTSTLQNPTHLYTSGGTFSVQLIVCNVNGCDTIIQSIAVPNIGGPISATCSPTTTSPQSTIGIFQVTFNTISHSSAGSTEGYLDLTCSEFTNVISGQTYTLTVNTGSSYSQNVKAWLDFNNNGSFETSEQILVSTALGNHVANVTIPTSAVINIPLRLRIGNDYTNQVYACTNSYYGQFEDYSVVIESNTLPPVAQYTVNVLDQCQGMYQFLDQSLNIATSWLWNFGDGSTSLYQNPYHMFTTSGTYNVILIATNSFGSDTTSTVITVNILNPQISTTGNMEVFSPIFFTAVAPGANSWNWDFGDGTITTQQNPIHVYSSPGLYTVTLTVTNSSGCVASTTLLLNIIFVNNPEIESNEMPLLFPNPAYSLIYIQIPQKWNNKLSVEIFDVLGQVVFKTQVLGQMNLGKVNIDNLTPAVYMIKIMEKENVFVTTFIKE